MRLNPQEQTKQTYNNGNGLAVTEFSDGAFYKDNATGILFFGGVNGFVTVKPDSYITTDYMPEISLKGLPSSVRNTTCMTFYITKREARATTGLQTQLLPAQLPDNRLH